MSVVYQDSSNSISQNIDAQGGEYIVASSPTGDKSAQVQLYVTPDAQVYRLQGNLAGLQLSQTGISCNLPDGTA